MSYSDALISQLTLLNYWQHNPEESEYICEELGDSPLSPLELQQNMANIFNQADTYYISEEISDVLVGGFDTLPNTPLGEMRPSSPYGWAYFERPVLCPFPTPGGQVWQVQALVWGPFCRRGESEFSGLNLGVFVLNPGHSHLPCSGMTNWSWEAGWDSAWPNLSVGPCRDQEVNGYSTHAGQDLSHWISKLTLSFFAFIRQECVSIQTAQASRPVRRHLPKNFSAEPEIKVIHLRRRGPAINGGEPKKIDYGCRWLVRGHWRNQFYRSSDSHRLIFIPPYVKGPDDKPLKKPAKVSLFAVVR